MFACNNMLRVELKTLMGFLCEIRLDFRLPHLRLGEPRGNPVGEVLPRLGEVVRLGECVILLGELRTASKCCFSCCTVLCVGWFLEELLTQRGLSPVI